MALTISDILQRFVASIEKQSGRILKLDDESSSFGYVGFAEAGSATSDETWRVIRIYRQGTVFTLETAAGESYDNAFDDRTTLFTPVALSNAYSLEHDGSDDLVQYGNNFGFGPGTAFSVSIWINANNFSANRCLFSKATNDGNVYGYNLVADTSANLRLQMRASGTNRAHTFTGTLSTMTWHHIVLTYDGGNNIDGARVYIDSVNQDTPSSGSLNSWTHTDPFVIGARNTSATFPFSGYMDQPAVFDKALNQTEVTELYNSGQPSDLNDYSAYNNILSFWNNGDGDTYPTILDQKGSVNGTMTNMTADDIVSVVP